MDASGRPTITHHASGALEFTGAAGVRWTVIEVARMEFSERLMSLLPHPERRGGWLLFESDRGDRRRLAPVPENWRTLPVAVLERCLTEAVPASANERRRRSDTP
jgi:hypothetical protein